MQKYKLVIEYDGTKYFGWQRQEDVPTIQGTIEQVLSKFLKCKIEIYGASRTDVGVHALCQVAHFEAQDLDIIKQINFNLTKFKNSINFFLKDSDIVILDIEQVNENFHARFDVKQKTYAYKIINRLSRTVLMHNKSWHIHNQLNVDLMRDAALQFIGQKNFESFKARHAQQKNNIRNIEKIEIHLDKMQQDLIVIYVTAKSFLHKMVRNIVGTLVAVALGHIQLSEIEEIFAKKNRSYAGSTAPACGLYLIQIDY